MIPDEAIKLNKLIKSWANPDAVNRQQAIQLGIEALERLKELREEREKVMPLAHLRNLIWKLLPSETEGGK